MITRHSRLPLLRLLIGISCLGTLQTCRPAINPVTPVQALSLKGHYQVLSLTEKPYLDDAINDLVLFDTLTQGCDKQFVTLSFAANGVLTTGIAPSCMPSATWLDGAGLVNASQWALSESTLVVTPAQGPENTFTVQFTGDGLELNWLAADSSFVGLDGQLVTYSLALKRL